ncbi:proline iminopeptidase [Metarhizium album ARSEF 1941]|uniref:Proline iminopeptidase n=1 Tax=Metarhizium album (strain ARSEF 1941) TaxID=1081103 RepID=A0A0B2WJU7_METAS|nr:proline iminopeptidase [Metarhizium album ARSEF 1941]KHN96296.1 proline iminopeptidase [Metarhizium album ARSEF 1941]
MAPAILDIPPAKLLSSKGHLLPGQLEITTFFFQVPLDYENPSAGSIQLYARRLAKRQSPIFPPDDQDAQKDSHKPYMVYLEGGPGFGNRAPADHPVTRAALPRGYQVLFIDHRGTGLSTPVSTAMLASVGDADAQAKYLRLMRQDNTVRDCEAVRKLLTAGWPEQKTQWSTFGQSYGGFITLSYLSMHPEGLRECFLTGGLAPVGKTVNQVYEATFRKTTQRNEQYFAKFPEDALVIRQIAAYIESQGGKVPLPAGGFLTLPRLLTIGIAFGGHGGFDTVHNTLTVLKTSLDQFGFLTRAALAPMESFTPFDTNIIYAILHEAIYCDGPQASSNWAANRLGRDLGGPYSWLAPDYTLARSPEPLYFSGEMIFPFHFETYPELIPLRDVAEKLATYTDWPALYDEARLRSNKVPFYAASYVEDMYVDYRLARDTSDLVKGSKVFETNVMYHNAVRAKADEVMHQLFSLRDDVLD